MALNLTGNDIIDTSIIRNLTQAASNSRGVKDFKLEDDTIKLITTNDEFSIKLPSASNALTNDDIGTKVAPLKNGAVPSDNLPSNLLTNDDIGTAAAKNYTSSISNNSTDLPTAEAVYSYINSLGIENIIAQIGNIGTEIDGIEQKLANIFSAENKVTDFNTTTNSGIYYWLIDAANRPTNYGVLLVNKFDRGSSSIWVNQVAYSTNGRIYFRQNINSGSWTEWKAVAFEGHKHSASDITSGTLPVANGGTGVTTQADINKAFIGNLDVGNSDVTDGTEFVSSWASDKGFAETEEGAVNKPYKRQFVKVWNYIKDKISSVLGLTATNYGGKAAKSRFLDEYVGAGGTRLTSGNIVPKDASEYGGMRKDVVTSSMTDSGRPGHDGHLLTMFWDTVGRYDSQFFVSNEEPLTLKARFKANAENYRDWVDIITSNNIGSQTVAKANNADTAGTADKTVNDIDIGIPYVRESGQYVIPLGNIPQPGSGEVSPYNWDITGFFSIIRASGHAGSHITFEAGHGHSHGFTTYAYLDEDAFTDAGHVGMSIKTFQYNGKWWLGLWINTQWQGYESKMTITYSRGLPATPTCILYNSASNGVANKEIYDSIQDIPSWWWRRRNIYNPTTFTQNVTAPVMQATYRLTIPIGAPSSPQDGDIWIG